MKYEIKKNKIENILDEIKELEKLLTDRIVDLHQIKDGTQSRHAYILYRNLLLDIKTLFLDSIKEG